MDGIFVASVVGLLVSFPALVMAMNKRMSFIQTFPIPILSIVLIVISMLHSNGLMKKHPQYCTDGLGFQVESIQGGGRTMQFFIGLNNSKQLSIWGWRADKKYMYNGNEEFVWSLCELAHNSTMQTHYRTNGNDIELSFVGGRYVSSIHLSSYETDPSPSEMLKEIRELRKIVSSIEPGTNKISKGLSIQSNDPNMVDFAEGKIATYSGNYTQNPNLRRIFLVSTEFFHSYNEVPCHPPPGYGHAILNVEKLKSNPLLIQFERTIFAKYFGFEIAHNLTHQGKIQLTIDLHASRFTKRPDKYSVSTASHYEEFTLLDSMTFEITRYDRPKRYQFDNKYHFDIDGIILSISVRCVSADCMIVDQNYTIRDMILM